MHTHTYAHEHTCACITLSTCWSTNSETHNLCTNMYTHTHTHMYKRIHIHVHTHMHIYIFIHVHTHTHIHIYTHTPTNCIYTRTQALLNRQRCSDYAESPTWRREAPPFSLSAAIQRGITLRGQQPNCQSREMTDKRRTTTTDSSISHHHDSALSRLHPLTCTSAEPIHPVHSAPKLPSLAVVPQNKVIFLPFWRVGRICKHLTHALGTQINVTTNL